MVTSKISLVRIEAFCGASYIGDGSKLYRIVFFVIFPFFVPISVCGETHFFGCFEPVRKGCCTSDARPVLFGNGLPHCKLTEASYIQKGKLHVIFIAVKI